MRVTSSSRLILLKLSFVEIFDEKSTLWSFLRSAIASHLLCPTVLLVTLFPNILNLRIGNRSHVYTNSLRSTGANVRARIYIAMKTLFECLFR
jgi:hypothetical protein